MLPGPVRPPRTRVSTTFSLTSFSASMPFITFKTAYTFLARLIGSCRKQERSALPPIRRRSFEVERRFHFIGRRPSRSNSLAILEWRRSQPNCEILVSLTSGRKKFVQSTSSATLRLVELRCFPVYDCCLRKHFSVA